MASNIKQFLIVLVKEHKKCASAPSWIMKETIGIQAPGNLKGIVTRDSNDKKTIGRLLYTVHTVKNIRKHCTAGK
jgi:hypothetical protein